jgi:hypothetical protein
MAPALPAPAGNAQEPVFPQRIVQANLQEAWAALAMIRETVETLGPVGAMTASEHLDGPTFMDEAEAIVAGIQSLSARADDVKEAIEVTEALVENDSLRKFVQPEPEEP